MAGAERQSSGAWDSGVYKFGSTSSGGTSGDTTPPTVSIIAPANGATISGTATIKCSASDNVKVASVQFEIDGVNLGVADTGAPYARALNAKNYSNGSHTLKAIARDRAGNQTASDTVTVNIANGSASSGPSTVSVTATTPLAIIHGANGAFTFTRTGSTKAPLRVNYAIGGTAVKVKDYYRAGVGAMPAAITIPAGSASVTMRIVARNNTTRANPETVIITLSPASAYTVGSPASATMAILSNN